MRKLRGALGALFVTTCMAGSGAALAQEAAEPAGDTTVEELLVTGRRAADRAAIELKRETDIQVDQVRADDVGRLPDQNVAEALRRLPGLSVANDMGEGRYLTVRGVSPDLLNVTLNGQTAAAPEPESRQVKLDDIPSGLIGAVTVVKTLTPDLDANAIAGQADIETVSAFDRRRVFGTLRGAYGYNSQNEGHPYEIDGSFGTLFGPDRQFGVVIAANHSFREIGAENFQTGTNWDVVDGFDVPLELIVRQYATERERTGAVANFDWRPNGDIKTFLRFSYAKYSDVEDRHNFGVELDDDELSDLTPTSGNFAEADGVRAIRQRQEDTSTFTASLGGEFNIGEGWLNIEMTATRAEKNDPRRDEWIFEAEGLSGSYDTSGDLIDYTVDAAAFDPSNYEFDEVGFESREAVENLFQTRIDYRHPIPVGDNSTFQIGAKYLSREKTSDSNAAIYDGFDGPDLTLDQFTGPSISSIFDGRYPFGPTVDGPGADSFFASNAGSFEIDEEGTVGDSLAADFRVNEKIFAAYIMTTLKFGQLTVIPGVRVERTESDYAAKAVSDTSTFADIDKDYDTFGEQSYTDWFPGVNVRYHVNDSLVLRGAITTAIGRPNYEQLAPITVVNTSDNEVEMGNPNLQPLTSTNFDAAVEYYFGDRGIISAAVFHKKIENPIYLATFEESGVFAGQELIDALVTRPTNAESATVTGIEFNIQYELSFLPYPFDGLSAGGSLTLVNSEAEGIPGRPGEKLPLANQSDRVASAQLTYEKAGFAARVAYTYRSAFLLSPGDSAYNDLYVDNFDQWDARVSYAVTKNAAVFLEGANINNEPNRIYQGVPRRLDEIERYGWSARLGAQLTF